MKKFILIFLLSLPVSAQNYVQITASAVSDSAGVALVSGQMLWTATDSHGKPISYQMGGGGQAIRAPIVCSISNGAITGTCRLANTQFTNPQNVCFSVTVKDARNQVVLGGPGSGYECLQPAADNAWCTVGVCNFDAYAPSIPIPVLRLPYPTITTLGGVFARACPNPGGQKMVGITTFGTPDCETDLVGANTFSIQFEQPTQADDGKFMYPGYPAAITITRVSCNADGGVVAVNLNARTAADWVTPVANVLASAVQCSTSPTDSVGFAQANVDANSPLALLIPAVSGTPTIVRVRVYFQLQ